MLRFFISAIVMAISLGVYSQQNISLFITDQQSAEPLLGVNIMIVDSDIGTTTDVNGMAQLSLSRGSYQLQVSFIGYETAELDILIPGESQYDISMNPVTTELGEVVVMSSRANRSISNIPSRIEVITDEIEEAATMDPSKIAHLLMHTTGIQVQQQSATSGNSSVRIQGLYGRYTQILKDGFPIYGGFTGGLGVLQIPPLDLRQVEFVKGSSSTLYGGGAIGGLINLISKVPEDEVEGSLHLNLSHIGNRDLNSFYSQKHGKWGMTIFTSNNTNTAYDVDDDGFSDVPEVRKFNFNPRVFYYLNDQTTISLGGTLTNENRIGGEIDIIEGNPVLQESDYFERNKSKQVSTLFKIDHRIDDKRKIEFRNSTNHFDRQIFLNSYAFAGRQFSTFSEFNYQSSYTNGDLTLGANLYTEDFEENPISTNTVRDQRLSTFGVFGQYIHDFGPTVSAEFGLRTDYNTDYGTFVLPKFGIVYKPGLFFTGRIGGGMGYKLPGIFTEDAEALAFESIIPIDVNLQEAEKSLGFNGDLTFRLITTERLSVTLTEYLFYNRLNNPLLLLDSGNGSFTFSNSSGFFETRGVETLLKASAGNFHLYFGYNYVDAVQDDDAGRSVLPLTPQHAIHGDLMFIIEGKWRCGIDAEYESEQVLRSGRIVRSLFKAGFLAERMFDHYSVYINLENWTDTRQTKYESLILAPATTPRFTEVWAPLDGFIFNAGIKVKI